MYKLHILLIIDTVNNRINSKSKQRWSNDKVPKLLEEGFTLAEILITLLIIGVVASIVVPALISDTQDAQYKVAYKKAFAVATQAWQSAINNNEIVSANGGNLYLHTKNFNTFKTYFKVIKDCPDNTGISNCWANGEMFDLNRPLSTYTGFIDNSGMAWTLSHGTWNYILVDTNGFSLPNKYGRDRFVFMCETKNGDPDGFPIKLGVRYDYTGIQNIWCPSGGCYYTSWLSN